MRKESFTLIELLIAIAIVAILAGAMMPIFNITRQEAKEAKALAEMGAIKMASMMLHYDTGVWPLGEGQIMNVNGSGLIDNLQLGLIIPDWAGPYLDEWHVDPWGVSYRIQVGGLMGCPGVAENIYARSFGKDTGAPPDDDIFLLITPDKTQ